MNRRALLTYAMAFVGTRALAVSGSFEITRTDEEWRALLSDVEYAVMREEETETPFSSPLDGETREGLYHCKGCELPVYSSAHKYNSETGWPSFWQSLPNAVGTKPDNTLFTTRTEVHCRRCGSHFGHIFDDGPDPTGKRHCLNGVSLTFRT